MSMGTLTMVAESVHGTCHGPDREFNAVSTDTRSLEAGDLFFALQGEHFDAAEFVAEAGRRGAAGAVVERRQDCELTQVEVEDARAALGDLARAWRKRMPATVIGITGSNGKTTVKEMMAAILTAHAGDPTKVLATAGNLNNEIGLPLTVLRIRETHGVAVLEMGASRRGDIAYLVDIATPDVGVVTNAGSAHLEGFGSHEAIAETKGEMFRGLPAAGVAVINRDDAFFDLWSGFAAHARRLTFGLGADADYRATDIEETASIDAAELKFRLHAPDGEIDVRLPMAGAHNVPNALAAAAATCAAGASLAAVRDGLASMGNVSGRLRALKGTGGAQVLDDSYNANPTSVKAAIDFLAARGREAWLVLGDMAELGPESPALHAEIGGAAKAAGVSRLYCVGDEAREAANAFGEDAHWFGDREALIAALTSAPRDSVTILVKGSRCMGLEQVVSALTEGER